MKNGTISLSTNQRMELKDITSILEKQISQSGISSGLVYLFNPHTTAGLTINEGADPAVKSDIISALKKIIPFDHPYDHLEGNSPAHIMASLFGSSLTIFIENGNLKLGTWQKIYFCEFDGPRTRKFHWRVQ
jgi:secondary thiamine-phosphate synthase enzyme